MEKWIDIIGFEGIYQISDLGRVKSLSRLKFCGKNSLSGTIYNEKILKSNPDNYGYHRVNLWKNGKSKMTKIHRLVCIAFLENPELKTDINHKNGIKSDNRLLNLEWCTRSDNLFHAYNTGLKKPFWKDKYREEHACSKEVIQLDKSGNYINTFPSIREAALITKINFACISEVCNGRRQKTAGGFKWKFK